MNGRSKMAGWQEEGCKKEHNKKDPEEIYYEEY